MPGEEALIIPTEEINNWTQRSGFGQITASMETLRGAIESLGRATGERFESLLQGYWIPEEEPEIQVINRKSFLDL